MSIRITGKGPGGAAPVDPSAPAAPAEEAGKVEGSERTAAVGPTGAVGQATGAAAPDAVAQVAGQLRAGEITVDQAVELLIDDAIERQVGRAVANARELAPELRTMLREYAAKDPYFAAKIRRLTLAK